MRKRTGNIGALCAALASSCVAAQTNGVTLYGTVDLGLRHGSGLLRVARIVFANKSKKHGLSRQLGLLGIGLVQRQLHAIGHIFANMGYATRQGASYGNLHHLRPSGGCCCWRRLPRLRFADISALLAASG